MPALTRRLANHSVVDLTGDSTSDSDNDSDDERSAAAHAALAAQFGLNVKSTSTGMKHHQISAPKSGESTALEICDSSEPAKIAVVTDVTSSKPSGRLHTVKSKTQTALRTLKPQLASNSAELLVLPNNYGSLPSPTAASLPSSKRDTIHRQLPSTHTSSSIPTLLTSFEDIRTKNSSNLNQAVKRTATGEEKVVESVSKITDRQTRELNSRTELSTVLPTSTASSSNSTEPQLRHMGSNVLHTDSDMSNKTGCFSTLPKPVPRTDLQLETSISSQFLTIRLAIIQAQLNKELVTPTNVELDRLKSLLQHADRGVVPGGPWSDKDDELLVYLKERAVMSWPPMVDFFPGRSSWHALQTRYSNRLKSDETIPRLWSHFHTDDQDDREILLSTEPPQPASQTRKSSRLRGSELVQPGVFTMPMPMETGQVILEYVHSDTDNNSGKREFADHPRPRRVQHSSNNQRVSLERSFNAYSDLGITTRSDLARLNSNHLNELEDPQRQYSYQRLNLETLRDSAALSSMMTRISRPPITELARPLNGDGESQRLLVRKRRSVDVNRPYLGHSERRFLYRNMKTGTWDDQGVIDWEGKVLHVDFLDEEIEQLVPSIQVYRRHTLSKHHGVRKWIKESMMNASEHEITSISSYALLHDVFLNRTQDSINSFLRDLTYERYNPSLSFRRLGLKPSQSKSSRSFNVSLRNRELGTYSTPYFANFYDMLGPSTQFTGCSGDVQTVAWAPDGNTFAIGCAALTDTHSQQYNNRNNLLIGDLSLNTLRELPDHALARKLTASGANSTWTMQAVQDPLIFSSISAIEFSPKGEALFSAGYDHKVRIWDLRGDETRQAGVSAARCTVEIPHRARIALLAVSEIGLFATGAERNKGGVKVIKYDIDHLDSSTMSSMSLSSPKAQHQTDFSIMPSCLRWGYAAGMQQEHLTNQAKYLACGFASWSSEHSTGEICVWDTEVGQRTILTRGTRNVFDVAWSPSSFGRLAICGVPFSAVNRGTRSVVRIYDSRWTPSSLGLNSGCTVELECPAKDINDLVFNPADEYLISAGCTDGVVYTWDLRKPATILHVFKHKNSSMPLDDMALAEDNDTGVRFLSWNRMSGLLYSGSSDGVVNAWNPYVSPENSCIRKVVELQSGVMSGAFSPDFSSLLLGEVKGSIAVLSLGSDDRSLDQADKLQLLAADEAILRRVRRRAGIEESIVSQTPAGDAARAMLQAKELKIVPFGDMPRGQAVQSVCYKGPYDSAIDAPILRDANKGFQLRGIPSTEPCHLPHSLPQLTEEEQGDSKFWESRIPERLQWNKEHNDLVSNPRCRSRNMTCFRCNTQQLMRAASSKLRVKDVLRCEQCRCAWRYDVLGYTLVDFETSESIDNDGFSVDFKSAGRTLAETTEEEMLLVDVATYHNSFWGASVCS